MKVLKEPKNIVLYSHAFCSWCMAAKEWLDQHGWSYTIQDTGKDPAARQKAIEISHQSLVPVIEVDDLVLGDFDTDQLEAFLQEHGYLGN